MTVRELIERLERLDPALPVLAPTGMDFRDLEDFRVGTVRPRYGHLGCFGPTQTSDPRGTGPALFLGVERFPWEE